MRRVTGPAIIIAVIGLGGVGQADANTAATVPAPAAAIAWRHGDVDDAFAEARESGRPVLLYWGAKWCPPCNAMKTTLFRDPAFIVQTRNFIPVYLDGDTKGAQGWGEEFHIVGYPTVIILRPDRSEVMRLSNADAPARLAAVLRTAAVRVTSVDQLLKTAAADPAKLSRDDWQLLANYDWFNDPRHFAKPSDAQATLSRLTGAAPDPSLARHFAFAALAATTFTGDKVTLTPPQQAEVKRVLPELMRRPEEVRANAAMLAYSGSRLIVALPDAADRTALGGQLLAALAAVAADPHNPVSDRFGTVNADITLAKAANGGKVPPAVLVKVRARARAADRATTDPMARQALVPAIAETLDEAGDPDGAIAFLKANLATAEAPAYHMGVIADIESERGHKAAALDWAHRAFDAAKGPATRVQWAIDYADAAMTAVPTDRAAVAAAAGSVIAALGDDDAGYYQRTQRKVQAWGGRLAKWSAEHDGAAVLAQLKTQMATVCATKGGAAASCNNWLQPA